MIRRNFRTLLLAFAAFAVAGAPAWAKREDDYVAPFYAARVLYSLVGVVPLAAVLVGICAGGMLRLSVLMPPPLGRFLKISIYLVIAGCLFAALDDLNDEISQPWFAASFFVAFIPGVALCLGAEESQWSTPLPLAAFLTVVTWIVLVLVGTSWQFWAVHHGIPASW